MFKTSMSSGLNVTYKREDICLTQVLIHIFTIFSPSPQSYSFNHHCQDIKSKVKASVLQKKSSFTIYCFSPASPGAPLHPPQEIQREVKSKSQKGKSEITDDKKIEIEESHGSYRHINRYEVQIANTPSPTKVITLLKSSTAQTT